VIFIVLIKWKQAPKREIVDRATKTLDELEKQGIKMQVYWTMGRYDAVTIMDAPNEKAATKTLLRFQDIIDTETMVAIPRDEAIKLL
jgi:uncharacterized protein with GYD domain